MGTVTQGYLKEVLDYNPLTGILTWKARPLESFATIGAGKAWNTRFSGTAAGNLSKSIGYSVINLRGRRYLAHRLIWLYTHGEFPTTGIDHINHIKTDNRMLNLRAVSHSDNKKNTPKHANNTSGATGVVFCKKNSKWIARIQLTGKTKHLGYFKEKDDAVVARRRANILYNFHENHGL